MPPATDTIEPVADGAAPARQPGPVETLVLALGNPLRGDNGVGAAVLDALRQVEALPRRVVLRDGGTSGVALLLLIEGYRRVIVVDAADIGCAPGAWARLVRGAHGLTLGNGTRWGTLHDGGLVDALLLAEALGVVRPEIVFFGVQPGVLEFGPGLSAPVRQAVPVVCAAVLKELDGTLSRKLYEGAGDGENSDCRR